MIIIVNKKIKKSRTSLTTFLYLKSWKAFKGSSTPTNTSLTEGKATDKQLNNNLFLRREEVGESIIIKMPLTCMDICKFALAVILPPLGVLAEKGCGVDLLINIGLTCLGFIPGIVHACYIICKYWDSDFWRNKPPNAVKTTVNVHRCFCVSYMCVSIA